MGKINMQQWVSDVINQKERIAIPIMTHPGIELIGKSVYEAVTDGNVHFEAIHALDKKYPAAACTVIMDLTVEAEAFGADVAFYPEEIPTVTGRLVSDMESVSTLSIPDMSAGRLPQYLLANKLAATHIHDKPVLGGCIGPFSLAGRLYDMSEIMMACYCEPDTAKALLSKCSEFLLNYCTALKDQGIDGIVIAEPAAGLLSANGCSEFSSFYIRPIVDTLQDENFMIVLHNCGNTGHCTGAMLETGATAYHFGNMMDMKAALDELPPDVLCMGNIDPVGLFKAATSEQMKKAVLDLLNQTASYPNFVLSSGCDIPPYTPHTNIEAFYNTLEKYNHSINQH